MASAVIRKEILDDLQHELTNPSTFLKQMLDFSKTGMVSLNIIQQMSKTLCKIPLDYLVHCLKKDNRFAFDAAENRVCLLSQLKTRTTETTPYGTIDPGDDDQDEPVEKEIKTFPQYKSPFFRPMFLTSEKVFPIYFDNDTFYVDDLPEKEVNAEKPNMDVPEHDVCDVKPLSNQEEDLSLGLYKIGCYNCGSTHHVLSECPQPHDPDRIRKARQGAPRNVRIHQYLFMEEKKDEMRPGKLSSALRSALDMDEDEEPPYYHHFRLFGYPPGYQVEIDPSEPVPTFESLFYRGFDPEDEEIKIFDDAYTEKDDDNEKNEKKDAVDSGNKVLYKIVDYGMDFNIRADNRNGKNDRNDRKSRHGVYGVNTSQLEAAMHQYQSVYPQSNTAIQQQQAAYQVADMNANNNYMYHAEYAYPNTDSSNAYYNYYQDYSAYNQYYGYQMPPTDLSSISHQPSSEYYAQPTIPNINEFPPPSADIPLSAPGTDPPPPSSSADLSLSVPGLSPLPPPEHIPLSTQGPSPPPPAPPPESNIIQMTVTSNNNNGDGDDDDSVDMEISDGDSD